MDPHRLAEARSLALHRAVAEQLAADPGLLEAARIRIADALRRQPEASWARRWAEVLARPAAEVCRFLVDEGELATELRQSTPFAGALDPRERWRIWRKVRARAESQAWRGPAS